MNNLKPEKLWRKDYIIIMLASTGISFCNYFFFSTLPIYAQQLTGTTAYSGLMVGIYTLAALAIRPFTGILSDKFGRKKLLIAGALLSSIACVLYNIASILILLIFIRILHGIGFGVHSTSGGAVAADVIPKSRMAEGIGYFGLYSTLALALAPGIALFVIGNGELQNFRVLFLIAMAVSIATLVFDCFITYENKYQNIQVGVTSSHYRINSGNENLSKTFLGFEYAVFIPSIVLILLAFAFSSLTAFLPLLALERNMGNVGLFFTINAIGLLVSRLCVGRITDRRGMDVVVIPAIIVVAISFIVISIVHSLALLVFIAFPIGLAQGAIVPAINALIFNRCSEKRRGTASAAYASSMDMGIGFGSIVFGFIAQGFNYTFVYLGSTLLVVIALVVYLSGIAKRTPHPIN
jgi:MFS family permease